MEQLKINFNLIFGLILGAFTLSLCAFVLLLSGFVVLPIDEKYERNSFFCGTCNMQIKEQHEKEKRKRNEAFIEGGTESDILEIGKTLWEGNCTSCHSVTDEMVVGPGLEGILERRNIEWLIPWVKNSQAVIKSGDKYAVELFYKYNKAVMTSFAFKDEEIKAIFQYIDKTSKRVVAKYEIEPKTIACP
jgi:cytochrome c2